MYKRTTNMKRLAGRTLSLNTQSGLTCKPNDTSVGDTVADESECHDLRAALHLTSAQGRARLPRATETCERVRELDLCSH